MNEKRIVYKCRPIKKSLSHRVFGSEGRRVVGTLSQVLKRKKMEIELTRNQRKVLDFLKSYVKKEGFPPTLREIASHFGLRGPRAPQKTLAILERKGYLRKVPGGSRAIEIQGVLPALGRTLSLPIIGRVKAGEPLLAVENIEGYLNLDRSLVSSEDVFLLRVQGDSMIEAHIQDGDFALIKPQRDAENGEIVVAMIEDEATIKRIFKKRDLIRLEPANPTVEPIVVRKGEKKVTIVGKVVGIFRKF
jgi:repressor LexA